MNGEQFSYNYGNMIYTVEVIDFDGGEPAYRSGHPDSWTPAEYATWDFIIVDVHACMQSEFDFEQLCDDDFDLIEWLNDDVNESIEAAMRKAIDEPDEDFFDQDDYNDCYYGG
jgi:hypothetical protein